MPRNCIQCSCIQQHDAVAAEILDSPEFLAAFRLPLYAFVMTSFSDIRKSFRFQREAKKVQKELKNIHVEAEASGVKVVVAATMEVVSVEIGPEVPPARVPALLVDALNRALKKAQVVSADRMQGIMGELGIGGAA